jgi:5-methylcytosine-specific restriction protein A
VRRYCFTPGCPALVGKGVQYCPQHTRDAARKDAQRRGTASERGYDRDWQAAAAAYLKAHPSCERCLTRGRKRTAVLVDHKVALRDGGVRLDPRNFQAQCRHCHGLKTHADARVREHAFLQAPPQKTAPKSIVIADENRPDFGAVGFV